MPVSRASQSFIKRNLDAVLVMASRHDLRLLEDLAPELHALTEPLYCASRTLQSTAAVADAGGGGEEAMRRSLSPERLSTSSVKTLCKEARALRKKLRQIAALQVRSEARDGVVEKA